MRHSGVKWLGEVPDHWEIVPLKRAFTRVRRTAKDDAGIVTAFRDGQVTLRSNRRSEGYTEADDYSGYQGIVPGDLAIHSMDAFAGAVGVSDSQGMCSPVLSVCAAQDENDPRYMAYQLRLMSARGWIEALSRSVRERTSEFRWAEAGNQKIALPPVAEQRAIADFLDLKLSRIDTTISKSQQLLSLIEERQAALEWDKLFGETIAGSSTKKLKYILDMRSGDGITSQTIEQEGEFPVYGGGGHRGYTNTFTHEGDFVLIGRQGALCGNVKRTHAGRFFASEHAIVCQPRKSTDLTWLQCMLTAMNLGQYSQSSAQPGLSVDVLKNLRVTLPPLETQRELGAHFDSSRQRFAAYQKTLEKFIEALKRRRSALISAAVTGTIDVWGKN